MVLHLVTLIIVGTAAALAGILATAFVRRAAHRHGLLDAVSSSRKIHKVPVPRLGGVGIVVAVTAGVALAWAVDPRITEHARPAGSVLLSVASLGLLVAVGVWDDIRGTRARTKLMAQVLAGVGLYLAGVELNVIAIIPGVEFSLGPLAPVATVFWIVSVINALNLIDGMDGLAGGVALIASLAICIVAAVNGHWLVCAITMAIAGAAFGFLAFNFHPASIFMGDTGSMFLGATLAATSILAARAPGAGVTLVTPMIILGLPLLDVVLAVIRRVLLGRSPFSADKDHLHHRMMDRFGFGQVRAVLTMYGIGVAFALLGIAVALASDRQAAGLTLLALGVGLVVAWRAGYLDAGVRFLADTRRRNASRRSALHGLGAAVSAAATLEELWEALAPLASIVEATRLELRLQGSGEAAPHTFQRVRAPETGRAVSVEQALRTGGAVVGRLSVSWCDGRGEVDRDEELAIEWTAMRLQQRLRILRGNVRPALALFRAAEETPADGQKAANG